MSAMFSEGEAVAVIGDDGAVKVVTAIVRVSDAGECVETADGRLWRNSTGVPRGGPRKGVGYLRRPDDSASIIGAAAEAMYNHVTLGGDPFAVALEESRYVGRMALTSVEVKQMVREMCHKAAGEVIRAYLAALDREGLAVAPKAEAPETLLAAAPPPPGAAWRAET